ncbi:MAG TPA: Zn-ribbon domain-containing OB-fold protein [Methanocorpusculum sp.]|nr:Zn-ribbon domain-containing OB-fold protein [Methanocorpusculum sp.]HJJ95624.1 Zn-ribbon domain-containing OB-fold protein [Methanocorpusculum sp.]
MTVARYWRKIPQRYNLIGTRCETCGKTFFPPRAICPHCRREGMMSEVALSGKGKILTFTIIHSSSEQYAVFKPYVLAIIELEEGARMTSHVICDPEDVYIGMPVHSVFRIIEKEGADGVIHYGTKFVPDD